MKRSVCCSLLTLSLAVGAASAADVTDEFHYRSPEEIRKLAKELADAHPDSVRLRILGHSPGGRDLVLMELGGAQSQAPAILVVANMEGNSPIASDPGR